MTKKKQSLIPLQIQNEQPKNNDQIKFKKKNKFFF